MVPIIVQYLTSASMGNFTVNVAMVAAEAGVDNQGNEIDAVDGVSASVTYTAPSLYLGLATEQDATAKGMDITRLVARYTLGALQLGGLYDQSSLKDLDNDMWPVSAKYSAYEKLAYKIQYGDAGFEVLDTNIVVDSGPESLSLGVDYLLSKNTTVFGYYTQESVDTESVETTDDN